MGIENDNVHKSYEGMSKLFQAMFPDSRIASKFSRGGESPYLICFGHAPHFKQLLKDIVNNGEV